jgi:hypothetical protein
MVLSGLAMVIFDSRIVHRALSKIQKKFRRNHPEQQIELGENSRTEPTQTADTSPNVVRVDNGDNTNTASGVSERPTSRSGSEGDSSDNPTPALRSQENVSLYSVKVGLLLFGLFIISFIIIMVLRGVLSDAPVLFRFFANIYLAGIFPFSDLLANNSGTIIFGNSNTSNREY